MKRTGRPYFRLGNRTVWELERASDSSNRGMAPHHTLVSPRPGTRMGTVWFPRANERFFCHVKEDTDVRGGVLAYAVQGNLKADLSACSCPHRQAPRLQKALFLDEN